MVLRKVPNTRGSMLMGSGKFRVPKNYHCVSKHKLPYGKGNKKKTFYYYQKND